MASKFSSYLGRIIREEIKKTLEERRLKSDRVIVFHGTSSKYLSSILANGLNPNPKEKTWEDDPDASVHIPSRQSYGGVYFANDLMTARSASYSATRKAGGNMLLVTALVQPRSAIPDEDDIKNMVSRSVRGTVGRVEAGFYALLRTLEDYKKYEDYRKETVESFINEIVVEYRRKTGEGANEKFRDYLVSNRSLMQEVIEAHLKRMLAHEKEDYVNYDYSEVSEFLMGKKEAEENYMDKISKLSVLLKRIVVKTSEINSPAYKTYRFTDFVGFSGRNRILSIVEIIPGDKRTKAQYVIKYGEPPEEFWDQTKHKIGSDIEVVDARVRK